MSTEAPFAAEPAVAVIEADQGGSIPRPIEHDTRPDTADKAVTRAQALVKGKMAGEQPKPDAKKPLPSDAQTPTQARRYNDVRNAMDKVGAEHEAKEAANDRYREPPSGFDKKFQAEWDATPDNIKAETYRRVQNLEQGFHKYKAGHEAYESVRHYDELAKRHGGNLRASLEQVTAIEAAFQRSPVEGMQAVCRHFGHDLHRVASQIAQMRPEHLQAYQHQSQVQEMAARMQQLQQQNQQVVQHVQRMNATNMVQQFAEAHPRFEELAETIAKEIEAGYDIEEAYQRAEKLAGGSPTGGTKSSGAGRAANPAGSKSIYGAPSAGNLDSSSRPKGKPPSISDSINRALNAHRR